MFKPLYVFRCKEEPLYLTADECQYIHNICILIMQYAKLDVDITATVQNLSTAALCACLDGMCVT